MKAGIGDDQIYGGIGNDDIYGGAGFDLIVGGAGNDVLRGEAGNDTFVFAAAFGNDVITDFDTGLDKINLSGLGLNAASLAASAAQIDAGVMITIGADTILMFGETLASVNFSSDFIFA